MTGIKVICLVEVGIIGNEGCVPKKILLFKRLLHMIMKLSISLPHTSILEILKGFVLMVHQVYVFKYVYVILLRHLGAQPVEIFYCTCIDLLIALRF